MFRNTFHVPAAFSFFEIPGTACLCVWGIMRGITAAFRSL